MIKARIIVIVTCFVLFATIVWNPSGIVAGADERTPDDFKISVQSGVTTEVRGVKHWDDNSNAAGVRPSDEDFIAALKVYDKDGQDITADVKENITIKKEGTYNKSADAVADTPDPDNEKTVTASDDDWVIIVSGLPEDGAPYAIEEDALALKAMGYHAIGQAVSEEPDDSSPTYTEDQFYEFTNLYREVEVEFTADKVLNDRDLTEGEFEFELKDTDGNVVDTAKNDAHGKVTFDKIHYTLADFSESTSPGRSEPIIYTITEIKGEDPSVYYDGTSKEVAVTLALTYTDESGYTLTADVLYDGAEATPVFTNELKPLIEINVTKAWKDSENRDGTRPAEVVVKAMIGDEVAKDYDGNECSITLSEANNWKGTITNLPKFDDNDKEIKYTVKEDTIEGYTAVVTGNQDSGFTVTNTRETEVYVEVVVNKIWDDNDDEFGKRPATVEVVLLADKQKVGSVKLDAAGSWSYKFTNLPKYKNGREIDYTIEEKIDSPLYNPSVKKSVKDNVITYNITNTYEAGTRDITIFKQWDDENDKRKVRPNEITVNIYGYYMDDNDEEITVIYDSVKITPDARGDWKATFNDLPATVDGYEVEYELEEDTVYWYAPTPDIKWNGNRVYMKNTYDENYGPSETTTPETGTQPDTKDKNTETVLFQQALTMKKSSPQNNTVKAAIISDTKKTTQNQASVSSKSPRTGDDTSIISWLIILISAALTAIIVVLHKKKSVNKIL